MNIAPLQAQLWDEGLWEELLAYLDMAARDPEHYLVHDARLPVNVVAAAVQAAVQPLLGQAKKS